MGLLQKDGPVRLLHWSKRKKACHTLPVFGRVIHLFEADYNLFLKIIYGPQIVKSGERNNARNDQQHGSRPRHMIIDALLLARFEKDLITQLKMNSVPTWTKMQLGAAMTVSKSPLGWLHADVSACLRQLSKLNLNIFGW